MLPDRVVVEVRIREHHDRLSGRIKACHLPLVCIAQSVHVASEVADICEIQHHALGELELWSKAGLVNISCALIRILRTTLDAGQIGRELVGWKTVLEKKDRRRTS